MGSGEEVSGEEEVSEGTGVAAGMRVLVGIGAEVAVGATASGVEEQAQATRATADMQMMRRSNLKEERVRRKSDHTREGAVSGLAGESLVLDAQIFVNDGGNVIEGTGADELGHFVAADDENGRLGGDAVFSGLREVGGNGAFVGCIFHAGGELGDVEAEGLSPCDLTFDAATAAAVLESVVMVIPESALFAGTLRTFGDCTRLGAQDSVVTVDHFDLAVVHVGGLNLLGRTKGPAPTAASLEVAIVEDGDQGVGRAEDVPAAIRDIYGYRRCSGLGLLIGDISCGGGLGCGGVGGGRWLCSSRVGRASAGNSKGKQAAQNYGGEEGCAYGDKTRYLHDTCLYWVRRHRVQTFIR